MVQTYSHVFKMHEMYNATTFKKRSEYLHTKGFLCGTKIALSFWFSSQSETSGYGEKKDKKGKSISHLQVGFIHER